MDRLDKVISGATFACAGELKGWLIELSLLRRSQIQPAVKYLGNTLTLQFNHIESEFSEVNSEFYRIINRQYTLGFRKASAEHLVEELIDLQFSCQTMLEGPLKLTKEQIADAIQKVVQKNKDRMYHIDP